TPVAGFAANAFSAPRTLVTRASTAPCTVLPRVGTSAPFRYSDAIELPNPFADVTSDADPAHCGSLAPATASPAVAGFAPRLASFAPGFARKKMLVRVCTIGTIAVTDSQLDIPASRDIGTFATRSVTCVMVLPMDTLSPETPVIARRLS